MSTVGLMCITQPPVDLMPRPFESMTSVVNVRAISHVFESIRHSSGSTYFFPSSTVALKGSG